MSRHSKQMPVRLAVPGLMLVILSLACSALTGQSGDTGVARATALAPDTPGSVAVPNSESTAAVATDSYATERPTPSEKPAALEIVKQGFGQDGTQAGYGFLVRNPNQEFAVENIPYQVAVYDSDDVVLKTDSGYISMVLPGQTLGVSGAVYLDEGKRAAKLVFQLGEGEYTLSKLDAPLASEKVSFAVGEYNTQVTGLIVNPLDRLFTDVRVSAIAYDKAGSIIGGGNGYVTFIPAKSSTGVRIQVSVPKTLAIDSVELYAEVSSFNFLERERPPAGAQPLTLDKTGFGQSKNSVGLGMLVRNPNAGLLVKNSRYRVTVLDDGGNVLTAEDGYIELLLPNAVLGVGGSLYLEEGKQAAQITFQLLTGEYGESDILPVFSYEKVTYLGTEYFPKVTGVIVNPFDKDLSNLRVSAIAFNASGGIIGGGYGYLQFLPKSGKAAAEVMVTTAGEPAKVELYASLTSLDALAE